MNDTTDTPAGDVHDPAEEKRVETKETVVKKPEEAPVDTPVEKVTATETSEKVTETPVEDPNQS